jgi:hypothetical protein
MVTVRLARQELLRSERPPFYSAILDEAAIRRPVGGPAVMRAQLARLLRLMDTSRTLLQVLPFEHGEHALMGGTLTILTMENRSAVAYEESIATGTLIEDPEAVTARERTYEQMRAYALSPRDSAALVRATMEALP